MGPCKADSTTELERALAEVCRRAVRHERSRSAEPSAAVWRAVDFMRPRTGDTDGAPTRIEKNLPAPWLHDDIDDARSRSLWSAPGATRFFDAVCAGRLRVSGRFVVDAERFIVCEQLAVPTPLSLLDRRILELVAAGAANKFIGFEVGLSTSRVGVRVGELSRRLDAAGRVDLILRARHLKDLDDRPLDRAPRVDVGGRRFFVGISPRLAPELLPLTPSQREVAALILAGCSNKEIAQWRRTSERTVANQIAALLREVGVASRFELVARIETWRPPPDPDLH